MAAANAVPPPQTQEQDPFPPLAGMEIISPPSRSNGSNFISCASLILVLNIYCLLKGEKKKNHMPYNASAQLQLCTRDSPEEQTGQRHSHPLSASTDLVRCSDYKRAKIFMMVVKTLCSHIWKCTKVAQKSIHGEGSRHSRALLAATTALLPLWGSGSLPHNPASRTMLAILESRRLI